MVTKVNSSFSIGVFEQELECNINSFGIGAQAPGSSTDPAGRPSGGTGKPGESQMADTASQTGAAINPNQTIATQARTGVNLSNTSAGGGRGSINPGQLATTANGSASTSTTGFANTPLPAFLDPASAGQAGFLGSVGSINNVLDPMQMLAQKTAQNTQGTVTAATGGVPVANDDYMGR
jgi:hypothetical protein